MAGRLKEFKFSFIHIRHPFCHLIFQLLFLFPFHKQKVASTDFLWLCIIEPLLFLDKKVFFAAFLCHGKIVWISFRQKFSNWFIVFDKLRSKGNFPVGWISNMYRNYSEKLNFDEIVFPRVENLIFLPRNSFSYPHSFPTYKNSSKSSFVFLVEKICLDYR